MRRLQIAQVFLASLFVSCGGATSMKPVTGIDEHQTKLPERTGTKVAKQTTLSEPLKAYRFNRLEMQVPESWDVSSDPRNESVVEDHIRIVRPDSAKFMFVRVSPANGEQAQLPRIVRMTALDFISKMSRLADFDIDEKGEGGGGFELWGRKGVLVTFTAPSRRTPLPIHVKVFGQYLEKTDDLFFINLLLAGEDNGELEAIVKSIRVFPR